jgi:TetR/AcrR family transcriptional regulator, ethionamide resistance regulator
MVAIRDPRLSTDATTRPRRRRDPADARAEILRAAAALLAERPSDEVTVAAIMQDTTLSRKSFYVYFRDRAEAITALVAPLRLDADAALARWRDSNDIVASGREALRSAAMTYRQHGAILRALATASERDDEAALVWRGFIEPLVAIATTKIVDATRGGMSLGLDPEPTARALVTMNVNTLLTLRPDTPLADVEALVATLGTIWERTIFLRHPSAPSR